MFKNLRITSYSGLALILFLFFLPAYTTFAGTISVDDGSSSVSTDGNCSLREAIINANYNNQSGSTDCPSGSGITDTITLTVDVSLTEVDNSTDGDNGLPSISSTIILEGGGHFIERAAAISETIEFRIVHVADSGNLTLNNVTISNGNETVAGGIRNKGTVTLTNSTLDKNQSSSHAGAIVNNGTMLISNSTVKNTETGNGVIMNYDTMTVNNGSLIRDNLSRNAGGGIYNQSTGTLILSNATFLNNLAWGDGGALYMIGDLTFSDMIFAGNVAGDQGGAIDTTGDLTIDNSIFLSNSASEGGAIRTYNPLVVTNSTFAGNIGLLNFSIPGSGKGGGIALFSTTATIHNSLFTGGSVATMEGSAIYQVTSDSTIVNSSFGGNADNVIYNSSSTMTIQNSVFHGNENNFNNSSGTVTVSYSGVEDGIPGGITDGGNNLTLNSGDTVFVAPEPFANAPTTAGDYHLASNSVVINEGSNALANNAGLTTDFEGDDRIVAGIVDLGADEVAFPAPPENANLLYNTGFTKGANQDAGWRFNGSIQHQVINGRMKLNFPTTVNGWMYQFRTQFPLASGLRMVGWVVVSNQDPVPKNFQLIFRDSDMSNTYLCNFTIPANTWNKAYYMRFITDTNWEIIRVDMRPNVADTNGLRFDNVNLRYRPWLSFTEKECISPNFSDETPPPPDSAVMMTDESANRLPDETTNAGIHPPEIGGIEGGCTALDWFNTDNWKGYLPTSEVQFIFDPFPAELIVDGASVYDANGDGVADTLYDALSYDGHGHAVSLLREAVIAMLSDRYDSTHPESWWAVEIDTAEALAQGENAMLELAQQYALSNATCG